MSPKRPKRVDYWDDPEAPKPTSRKPSASVLVADDDGRILLLRRTDNDLWSIPTGGLKKAETITQCAVRECLEETGVTVEITGLVGVFSDPRHVIAYRGGEVRQPVNVCLHARPVAGYAQTTPEAAEVLWIDPADLDSYDIHPALRRRIDQGLTGGPPHID